MNKKITPKQRAIDSLADENFNDLLKLRYAQLTSHERSGIEERISNREVIIDKIEEGKVDFLSFDCNRRIKEESIKPGPPFKMSKKRFHQSKEWAELRYQALQKYERKCACCGLGPEQGVAIEVDHIKPVKKYPELKLDINNLQILCRMCNRGKSHRDCIDYRVA
ncbi:hypothetical protein R84981_002780 [Carnimonas sp. R-84981]|uniref:HNH endonuclease n=1 Tax=Carnimonas bestiolae TaxID=3402172 RepID=UPI003EDC5E2C